MGYGFLEPPLAPLGQGMLSQNPIGLPTAPKGIPLSKPFSPLKLAPNGIFGLLAASSAINHGIGTAGGYKWRDDLLAKIGNGKGAIVDPPTTTPRTNGVVYEVWISFTIKATGARNPSIRAFVVPAPFPSPASFEMPDAPNGDRSASGIGVGSDLYVLNGNFYTNFSVDRIVRQDGQTDPPTEGDRPRTPKNEGYTPPPNGFLGDNPSQAPSTTPSQPPLSPARSPSGNPNQAPSNLKNPPSPSPSPNPPTTPQPSPPLAPSPNAPPLKTPSPTPSPNPPTTPQPKAPETPPKPNDGADLGQRLREIAAMLFLVSANTSQDSLKNAAKTGTCDTLKSPSCTKDMEDRIKNPINANIDGKTAALAGNQVFQNGVLASIVTKLDLAKEFADKVSKAAKLDKVYTFLTYLTVTHNAAMLSNQLAVTLGDTLSLGLATFGIKDGDSPIDINAVIGKTAKSAAESVIGAANFATLSERWAKAVRVYQAGANIVYNVRSLWDSARALQELTGANVGQLMNSLRKDGVVSEDAYGSKAESPVMLNSAMNKLQNLEEAASHLSSITSNTYGMTETVAQMKRDKDDFDKLIKESPPKAAIENDVVKAKVVEQKAASKSPALAMADFNKETQL